MCWRKTSSNLVEQSDMIQTSVKLLVHFGLLRSGKKANLRNLCARIKKGIASPVEEHYRKLKEILLVVS